MMTSALDLFNFGTLSLFVVLLRRGSALPFLFSFTEPPNLGRDPRGEKKFDWVLNEVVTDPVFLLSSP